MDISPEYIKMCENAKEIQSQWKPSAWDWCFCKGWRPDDLECSDENPVVVLSGYCTDGGYYGHEIHTYDKDEFVISCSASCDEGHYWLPRQDQLQEMIKEDDRDASGYRSIGNIYQQFVEETVELDNLCDICGIHTVYDYCKTWEQLWLGFVMYKNYHKRWDGKAWIYSKLLG